MDLRSNSATSTGSSISRPLRSPRLHVAGEAPPELSPLDAFALQSRLLARQLQDSAKDGSRMSRLPPLTMESPLIVQGRSDYFRSMSQDSGSEQGDSPLPISASLGFRTEVEDAFSDDKRPQSMHPRMSRIPPTPNESVPAMPEPVGDFFRGRQQSHVSEHINVFGARQDRSPSPFNSETQSQSEKLHEKSPISGNNPLPNPSSPPKFMASPERRKQSPFDELGLVPPPRSLFPKRSSSIISSSPVPTDDETPSTLTSSFHSLPARKMSSGSAAFSHPMASPALTNFQRSPSVASDSSAFPRPSFNFSRPLSRAGTPNFELPIRQASSDSQPSFILADESAQTPISMHSEAFLDSQMEETKTTGSSYIYSKFSLPRGKTVQRSENPESLPQASFHWEQPMIPPSNVKRIPPGAAPPSPPTRPSSSSTRTVPDDAISVVSSMTRPSTDAGKVSLESSGRGPVGYPSPNPSRPSVEHGRRSEDVSRGRPFASPSLDIARGRTPASTGTSDSASTIRQPTAMRSLNPIASEMTAEEHLAKGVECHENGSLNESTYHLRLAARQNNPTAMLLYALACRHGWGMRPNQKEGVEWLRKAAEYASIEIADDEDQMKEGKRVDITERKTRKAQFALSIYELGVSHMNGWGIEQDKGLALRCFEIAGSKLKRLISRHILSY